VISGNARFAIMAVALAGAALLVQSRTHAETRAQSSVAALPLQIGNWTGADIPFSPRILASVGPGQFLQRTYQERNAAGPYVDLYVAYRPDRWSLGSHLPNDCLIGSGWAPVESGTTIVNLPGSAAYPANRYLIAKGTQRQLVLFWFWVHGRSVASESWTDFYLTLDSLRLNRNDYAVVRINTPLAPGENAEVAQHRLLAFAGQLQPVLDKHISR
jgi:EpsI family protein